MKNIKKFSLLLVIASIILLTLSCSAYAQDKIKEIEENDKIYAFIPWEYELAVFDNDLAYNDENGNYIEFCVGENKFAPKGITSIEAWQVQKVFEHYYLYDGDVERIDECTVKYKEVEKKSANGYACYYLMGNYAYVEDGMDSMFAYYFNVYVFATKEDIIIVGYEDVDGNTDNFGDLLTVVNGIVLNGTHLNGDKPKRNADHDFSNSPIYEDVVTVAQGPIFEDGILGVAAVIAIIITVVPTLIVIIIAIVLIRKYSKVKKTLRQCELTYGSILQYNKPPQNYGGYGYNQPANQPYQQPVNPPYQQNPINQNIQQTPSYVTNAVNNFEANNQPQQPAKTNLPPDMQENQINNENKI